MTTFVDRHKELFKQLRAAEKQAPFNARNEHRDRGQLIAVNKRNARHARSEMKQFRGRESIFKRPEAPLSHCLPPRVIPGYLKNPKKWTKYSLEDVPDVSERSNAEAAAMCRRDIMLDQEQDTSSANDDTDSKVVFKQPILRGDTGFHCSEKSKAIEYKNSVVVYPEHVVGQKSVSRKVKVDDKNKRSVVRAVLKLDHLEEDDDIEE